MIKTRNLRYLLQGRVLLRAVPFPAWMVKIGSPDSVSVGEIIGVSVFLTLNLLTIGVRVRRSLPGGSGKNLYIVDEGDAGKEDAGPPPRSGPRRLGSSRSSTWVGTC